MDKYLADNNEVNYKPCKKYYDGYCWEDPNWYCLCDYEGCQPICEEYEEEDQIDHIKMIGEKTE